MRKTQHPKEIVIPAKAGNQLSLCRHPKLDPGLRRGDE
jgi:hypothetical protein